MTEAVKLMCKLCFETLKANRVEIRCDSLNLRSAAIPRRVGFIHEGTLRNSTRGVSSATKGQSSELRDMHLFSLIPEDYARISSPP